MLNPMSRIDRHSSTSKRPQIYSTTIYINIQVNTITEISPRLKVKDAVKTLCGGRP